MLAPGLGVLEPDGGACAVLPDRSFDGGAAIGVDGVSGAAQEGARQAALGVERRDGGSASDDLSRVPAHEGPFAGLSFELDHIEHVARCCGVIVYRSMRPRSSV